MNSSKHFSSMLTYLLLIGAIGLSTLLSITVGTTDISPIDALYIMISKTFPIDKMNLLLKDIPDTVEIIVLKVRLPRILMAIILGMNLSVSGSVYQGIFKNPMADPYILGIASGASFGAAIGIVSQGFIPLYAFIGSILSTMLVYLIGNEKGRLTTSSLLLAGIAINLLFSSLLSFVMIFFTKQLEQITFWTMGSLGRVSIDKVPGISVLSVLIVLILMRYRQELNILSMGEEGALHLGVEVEKVKKILLILCSILIALSVSYTGTIGFVGLVIPHIVRMIHGGNYKKLMTLSALYGALFLILSDTLSRGLVKGVEIPIGVITSLVGAPFFIFLLLRNKRI